MKIYMSDPLEKRAVSVKFSQETFFHPQAIKEE